MKLAKVIYDDTEKLAGELGKYLAFGLAGSGITIGTGLTIDAMHKIKKKNKEKKTWAAIKKRYPEFNNPDSKELFESMYDVNPTEMKHIPFIIPALKQAKEYSTEGAPTQLVSELARMEGTHRAGKPDLVDRVMRGYESGLATVKAVDDIKVKRDKMDREERQLKGTLKNLEFNRDIATRKEHKENRRAERDDEAHADKTVANEVNDFITSIKNENMSGPEMHNAIQRFKQHGAWEDPSSGRRYEMSPRSRKRLGI